MISHENEILFRIDSNNAVNMLLMAFGNISNVKIEYLNTKNLLISKK